MTDDIKEDAEKVLSLGDDYLRLRDSMESDLRKTGFDPKVDPPCKEPSISRGVTGLAKDELMELYDSYLAYYDYISDEITRLEVYLRTTEKRASVIKAHLTLEASKRKKELSNAELRGAWVEVHPSYQSALQDHLYFKQMHDAQEQRLRKMSKAMDKVYWAMWARDQPHPDSRPMNKSMDSLKDSISNFTKPNPPKRSLFRRVGDATK